jgi:hypothetical protein
MEAREFESISEMRQFAQTYASEEAIAYFAPTSRSSDEDPRYVIGLIGNKNFVNMESARSWSRAQCVASALAMTLADTTQVDHSGE